MSEERKPETAISGVLVGIIQRPLALIRGWNWKSALLSALIRGSIFFTTNLSAGIAAASMALLIEASFFIVTAGFYGAILQSLRRVQPFWHAVLAVTVILPTLNHTFELILHRWGGTRQITVGVIISFVLSIFSATFNLFAMRRGVLIVGRERQTFWQDMRRMPGLVIEFLLFLMRNTGVRQ